MSERDERIERLPKWARDYIGWLERENEHLRNERKSIAEGTTSIYYEDHELTRFYLPERSTVTFGDAEVDLRQGDVHIRSARGKLAVYPRASNSVIVKVEPISMRGE